MEVNTTILWESYGAPTGIPSESCRNPTGVQKQTLEAIHMTILQEANEHPLYEPYGAYCRNPMGIL